MAQNMTEEEIKKIYEAVKSVFDKKMTRDEGFYSVDKIVSSNYAFMSYFRGFRAMKSNGEHIYRKSIGEKLTRCFLEIIRKDDGCEGLQLALNALQAHIKYRQTPPNKHNMGGYIKILTDFSDCDTPPNTQQEENIGNTSSPIKETTKVIGGWIAHKGKDPIKIKTSLVGAISYNRTTKEMRIVASHGLKVNIPCTEQEYDEVDNATNN